MAISLNTVNTTVTNHETRIKALESKGASSWTKGSNSNGYWAKETTTGLIIQWGIFVTSSVTTRYFPISFTSQPSLFHFVSNSNSSIDVYEFMTNSWNVTNSSYRYNERRAQGGGWRGNWLAIGYLISDRILNYIYKAFAIIFTLIFGIRLVSKITV